jgi:hypothetical protein
MGLLLLEGCGLFNSKPSYVGFLQVGNHGRMATINDTLLFLWDDVSWSRFDIINARHPDDLHWQDSADTRYAVRWACFRGTTGFLRLGMGGNTILSYDVSGGSRAQYRELCQVDLPWQAYGPMALNDSHLYVCSMDTLYVVDAADPESLRLGHRLFLPSVTGYSGLIPAGPVAASDKWLVVQWGAYWNADSFWVSVYDISNPSSPVKRGEWRSSLSFCITDMAVKGDICYVTDPLCIRTFDLANAAGPKQLDSVDVYYEWRDHNEPSGSHGAGITQLVLAGRFACLSANVPGNALLDVSNPRSMRYLFPARDDHNGLTLGEGCAVAGGHYYVSTYELGMLHCFDLP